MPMRLLPEEDNWVEFTHIFFHWYNDFTEFFTFGLW